MAKSGHSWKDILEAMREADLEWPEDRESENIQHRSIWSAMKARYDVLTENKKERFVELSVFVTDQTIPEAAVQTLWAHTGQISGRNAAKMLINLAERSLIRKRLINRSLLSPFNLFRREMLQHEGPPAG